VQADDLQILDHADSVWNRAAAFTAPDLADPLCCRSEWQLSFHETLAPRQPVLWRSNEDSIAAFAIHEDPELGFVLSALDWSWKFGSPLLGPSALELLGEILGSLFDQGRRPSVLVSGFAADTPSAHRVRAAFRHWTCWQLEAEPSSVASLDGGLDGYLSRRSGQLRRNLRKALHRAAERGVAFERCTPRDAKEADAAFERIVSVERRSWKGGEEQGVVHPLAMPFYRRLFLRVADAGLARVVFARHGEDDVGFLFGSLAGGTFRAQQFSFAREWRPYSIGNLLQLEAVSWLCDDGALCYHMGPTMEYKPHWAEQTVPTVNWLFSPGQ
jgi:CelD/BcsL family acetyltransferase involved in cellulose biosynthesis